SLRSSANALVAEAANSAGIPPIRIVVAVQNSPDNQFRAARKMLYDGFIDQGMTPEEANKRAFAEGGKLSKAFSKIALLQTIKENVGNYVHRSYQAFDDPKWR